MKSLFDEIAALDTESISDDFANIDIMSIKEILTLLNEQDMLVPTAITSEITNIAIAVENIVKAFQNNGRLIYIGAGTSGRLGVLDASECPPTFGTDTQMVQGYIAGGKEAAFRAIEGAEDIAEDGASLISSIGINENDVVCGLTASGRTPYVLSALEKAKSYGAFTILISTNSREQIIKKGVKVDTLICPKIGAEVIAGSTRMKSGTAQKLILNMLTTTSMIKIGKTYKNIMIDLQPTNNKLKERAKRILMVVTGISLIDAENILAQTSYNLKLAITMELFNLTLEEANISLEQSKGIIRNIR
jgi:N-acetylmuramic acid 6-phosphate etherase